MPKFVEALVFKRLISRFGPYYQLAEYLAGYTDGLIGLAVGLPTARQIDPTSATSPTCREVALESTGRLFKRSVKMYVLIRLPTPASNEIHTVVQSPIPAPWNHLRDLLP